MTSDRRNRGEKTRRKVMGDPFVDAALLSASEFDRPLQDMVCEFAWGGTWSEDHTLSMREKSMITISMLITQKSWNELRGHIRGALNNGCTKEEIRSIIHHSTTYCGYPSALSAMKTAQEVITEYEARK